MTHRVQDMDSPSRQLKRVPGPVPTRRVGPMTRRVQGLKRKNTQLRFTYQEPGATWSVIVYTEWKFRVVTGSNSTSRLYLLKKKIIFTSGKTRVLTLIWNTSQPTHSTCTLFLWSIHHLLHSFSLFFEIHRTRYVVFSILLLKSWFLDVWKY